MNVNLKNFLVNASFLLLNYGANKLNDKVQKTNTTKFAPTRSAIYNTGLEALFQEAQDRKAKDEGQSNGQTTEKV
jgi:hypothetical protein